MNSSATPSPQSMFPKIAQRFLDQNMLNVMKRGDLA
jgi:hypothetical protein